MASLIQSGSDIRTYRVSGGNMLDGIAGFLWRHMYLIKNVLIFFDSNAENNLLSILMYLQNSEPIYL